MKFIMVFWFERLHRLWRRSHISLRRDKRLPHGVRSMQTPTLQRCRSSSQKIFAGQIFFGSPVFILVRTAMRLCSHSHISLRYNASLLYPVRPCRGIFVAVCLPYLLLSSPPKFIFCREPVRSSASLALFGQCKSPAAVCGRAASYYVD